MDKILRKLMIAWIIIVSVSFIGCQDDDNLPNNSNQNTNPSDTTSSEYPLTAQVIHNAVADIDGNSYDAVQIGDQIWMASNLRTTREPSGTFIPESSTRDTIPLRYKPNTDIISYGYLYNCYAAMNGESYSSSNPSGVQGICPNGWHLPSAAEWQQLEAHILSVYSASWVICAQNAWPLDPHNINYITEMNATGFSAYPAGRFSYNNYEDFGEKAYWGTSSSTDVAFAYWHGFDYDTWASSFGNSIRCVKD